jgi:hypothetical protein
MACKSADIKSPHTLFASVAASNELDEGIRIVCIKVDDLNPNQ